LEKKKVTSDKKDIILIILIIKRYNFKIYIIFTKLLLLYHLSHML